MCVIGVMASSLVNVYMVKYCTLLHIYPEGDILVLKAILPRRISAEVWRGRFEE